MGRPAIPEGLLREALALKDSGVRTRDIAARFGVTPSSVDHWIFVARRLAGIPVRERPGPPPMAARDAELHRLFGSGLTSAQIGERFGMTAHAVGSALARHRARTGIVPMFTGRPRKGPRVAPPDAVAAEDSEHDTSGERCRCGLRLPCNNCLPTTAAAYAQQVRTHYSDVMGDRIASWRGGKRVYR